jgi:anthranilate synthase component II
MHLDLTATSPDKGAAKPDQPMPAITLIDNYDSFTFNLVHYLGTLGAKVKVWRNDKISVADVIAQRPDAIVLSPGPGVPGDAGICCDLLMGVCLGHQAIGEVFGGTVRRAFPMHGKLSQVEHEGQTLFRGINGPFQATRYHSLVVDQDTMPDELAVTARTADGIVMGLSHKTRPVHGVQFHPESIASEHGHRILQNFLDLAQVWNQRHRQQAA